MGANARKRREAKGGGSGPHQAFNVPFIDPTTFNRMARSSCSECGSSDINWTTLGVLAQEIGPKQQEAKEILPLVGASAEAWTCNDCSGFGAFEQTLHSSWD